MSDLQGRIVGEVLYAEGDGAEMKIPPGPCEITLTPTDATITWKGGDSTSGATAISMDVYKTHLSQGAIVLGEPKA